MARSGVQDGRSARVASPIKGGWRLTAVQEPAAAMPVVAMPAMALALMAVALVTAAVMPVARAVMAPPPMVGTAASSVAAAK